MDDASGGYRFVWVQPPRKQGFGLSGFPSGQVTFFGEEHSERSSLFRQLLAAMVFSGARCLFARSLQVPQAFAKAEQFRCGFSLGEVAYLVPAGLQLQQDECCGGDGVDSRMRPTLAMKPWLWGASLFRGSLSQKTRCSK